MSGLSAGDAFVHDGESQYCILARVLIAQGKMDVLRLLSSSLSTVEIAIELYVSVNTVRTHVRNIYAKLDVHRRLDVVRRAQELGLL